MLKGLVVGTATSTLKHSSMERQRLLVVQPQLVDGQPDGDPLLALDFVGAGVGEMVILTSDGGGAREYLKADATPVRWTTIGIVD